MNRFEGRRSRILLRNLGEVAFGALFIGTAMALVVSVWHGKSGMTITAAIGIPVAAHSLGGLIRTLYRMTAHTLPVVSWDQDGLTYLTDNRADDVQLPWSDLQGFGYTWDYPARLKIRRVTGQPFVIDLFAYSSDERARLLGELAVHSRTLPTQRW